jgi:hypothetical protein
MRVFKKTQKYVFAPVSHGRRKAESSEYSFKLP